jgi:uncharacterized protein
MRRLKNKAQKFTAFIEDKQAEMEEAKKEIPNIQHPYFLLFFGVFILIYSIVNFYIYIHGYRMLVVFDMDFVPYTIIFCFLSGSYILGEIIQQKRSSIYTDILITFGWLWFVGIVHFFFISVLYDSLKITNFLLDWFSGSQMESIAYHTTWITVIGTILTIVFGYINARTPTVRYHELEIKKRNYFASKLRMVIATDIHIGATNGVSHIKRIVKKINTLSPDVILLPGDIVDGELEPVIRRDIGSYLRKLEAPHGVWWITGNHEYIGGVDAATKYLTEHSIQLLEDTFVEVAGIVIVGRKDIASARFGDKRKGLEVVMGGIDHTKPIILMDHQPRDLAAAEKNGVDIQFSGHTHNGQLWPIQFIVRRLFELAAGYKKKWNTHIFVSSGVGTWGPPVRTSSRPEILCVDVSFTA